MKQIVFGPILSRRFGVSLGVDLSPQKKQCNFDCVYCELGGAKTMFSMDEVLPLEAILEEIHQGLAKHPHIDVLSITANGEPTLYPCLFELSSQLRDLVRGKCKTLILSNGSNFGNPSVARALQNFDIVKFSLDCVSEKCFKKIDRPHRQWEIEKILDGIKSFAMHFQGELVAEVLVIKGLNDNLQEMQKIAHFLRGINITRVDLGSIDRPPAYRVEGISIQDLESLSSAFDGLYVSIPKREKREAPKHSLEDSQELLEIIARRPIAEDEFLDLFAENGQIFLEELFREKKIQIKNVANMKFFALSLDNKGKKV